MRRISASASLLLSVACGTAPPDAASTLRTDSAGVSLVTIARRDRPIDIRFEKELEIGGDPSGPAFFYGVAPRRLAAASDGRIAVLDGQGFRVSLFDSTGSPIGRFGREGDGPGEFGSPSSIAFLSDGGIAVFDYEKRALQHFDSVGAFVAQRPLGVPFNGLGMVGTPSGLLLLSQNAPRGEGELVRRVLHLSPTDTVQLGPTSASRASPVRYASCGIRLTQPPLFASELVWASNGRRTAIAAGAEYSVHIFDETRLVAVVRRDLQPEAVTKQVLERVLGEGERWSIGGRECVVPPTELIEQRGHAPAVPIVEALALAPSGRLWVKRRTTGSEERRIDVFASDGEYLGTADGDSPFPVTFLPGGQLVTIETDSLDVQRVVTYRVTLEAGGRR